MLSPVDLFGLIVVVGTAYDVIKSVLVHRQNMAQLRIEEMQEQRKMLAQPVVMSDDLKPSE